MMRNLFAAAAVTAALACPCLDGAICTVAAQADQTKPATEDARHGAAERQSVLAAVAEAHSVSIDVLDAAARDEALAGFSLSMGEER
jgi:hypothetical protein